MSGEYPGGDMDVIVTLNAEDQWLLTDGRLRTDPKWFLMLRQALLDPEAQAAGDRIAELEDWVRDAGHHPGCPGGNGYRCKCGRDDLIGDTT